MPNWCSNSLEVSGPERVLNAWVSNVERNAGGDVGLFGTFVAPAYDEGQVNWYDAHCVAWGTKWDVEISKLDFEKHDDVVKLVFESAWSPPVTWLESMSRDWPSLRFALAFEEPGMCFMGYVVMKDGDFCMAEDECVNWEYSEDEKKQLELDEAYSEAMSERRDQLMFAASDAFEKAMYE